MFRHDYLVVQEAVEGVSEFPIASLVTAVFVAIMKAPGNPFQLSIITLLKFLIIL